MHLIASFRVLSGHEETVHDLLTDYAAIVRATDGTVRFETFADAADAQCIVVIEQYRDAHVFQQHINAPENAQFNAELSSHIEGAVHLQFLTSLPESLAIGRPIGSGARPSMEANSGPAEIATQRDFHKHRSGDCPNLINGAPRQAHVKPGIDQGQGGAYRHRKDQMGIATKGANPNPREGQQHEDVEPHPGQAPRAAAGGLRQGDAQIDDPWNQHDDPDGCQQS